MANPTPSDTAAASGEPELYASRKRIYPRSVTGTFRTLKWWGLWVMLGVYHIVPWLRWDRGEGVPDQAILLDLTHRRGYILNIEIWPQEVYYLTGLLVLAAVGLFFATALFGRVWCGFACPQTVWTDLYMWIERKIEGDRNARIRRDRGPWGAGKLGRKVAKHLVWVLVAFLMSFAWVWYFNDAPTVTREILAGEAGTWVYAFIFGLTFTTYLLAGLAREQVCIYMCPWPRFQGAMFDEHSLVITYEEWRGEPRAVSPKDGDFTNRGHCVDCRMCVHVCPTGIDIRDGQQMECIGCALCVDACNNIMDRFKLPRGLITYDSIANQVARSKGEPAKIRLVRPRTIIYASVLAVVTLVMVASLATRSRLDVSVQPDRAPLFVTLSDGSLRNGYTFKVLNMESEPKNFTLRAEGIDRALLTVIGHESEGAERVVLPVGRDTVGTFRVFVRAARDDVKGSSVPLSFVLQDNNSGEETRRETVFNGPVGP